LDAQLGEPAIRAAVNDVCDEGRSHLALVEVGHRMYGSLGTGFGESTPVFMEGAIAGHFDDAGEVGGGFCRESLSVEFVAGARVWIGGLDDSFSAGVGAFVRASLCVLYRRPVGTAVRRPAWAESMD